MALWVDEAGEIGWIGVALFALVVVIFTVCKKHLGLGVRPAFEKKKKKKLKNKNFDYYAHAVEIKHLFSAQTKTEISCIFLRFTSSINQTEEKVLGFSRDPVRFELPKK